MKKIVKIFGHFSLYFFLSLIILIIVYLVIQPSISAIELSPVASYASDPRITLTLAILTLISPIFAAGIYQIINWDFKEFRIRFRWRLLVVILASISVVSACYVVILIKNNIDFDNSIEAEREEIIDSYYGSNYIPSPSEAEQVINEVKEARRGNSPAFIFRLIEFLPFYVVPNIWWLWIAEGFWSLFRWLRRRS